MSVHVNLKYDKDICSKSGREILEEVLRRELEDREEDRRSKRLYDFLVKEGWIKE